jgi:hypothetical protein
VDTYAFSGAKVAGKGTKVALKASEPTDADNTTSPTAWKAAAVEVVDNNKDWAIKVTAICLQT